MSKGLFITFEGIDGCGKSTQARLLGEALQRDGHAVIETREPGGTPIAEKIRSVILDPDHGEMVNECELLLYLAARSQHVRQKILPALDRGSIVVCDRFQDATVAYQGFGRGISLEFLFQVNLFAAGRDPDLTFVFDISVDDAFERLRIINKQKDRLEATGKEFFEKIRQGYIHLANRERQRIILLDGTLSIEALSEKIYAITTERIGCIRNNTIK